MHSQIWCLSLYEYIHTYVYLFVYLLNYLPFALIFPPIQVFNTIQVKSSQTMGKNDTIFFILFEGLWSSLRYMWLLWILCLIFTYSSFLIGRGFLFSCLSNQSHFFPLFSATWLPWQSQSDQVSICAASHSTNNPIPNQVNFEVP